MKGSVALVVLVLGGAFAPVVAGEPAVSPGAGMEECKLHRTDLAPAEYRKAMDEMFAKIDRDGNGVLSRDEFASHHEEMQRRHREHAEHADHAGHAAAPDVSGAPAH